MTECKIKKHGNITSQDGKGVKLTYGLTVGQTFTGQANTETYGIAIYSECEGIMSCESVEDISPNLTEIERLIDKLVDFEVTPTTLRDIINDYIEN